MGQCFQIDPHKTQLMAALGTEPPPFSFLDCPGKRARWAISPFADHWRINSFRAWSPNETAFIKSGAWKKAFVYLICSLNTCSVNLCVTVSFKTWFHGKGRKGCHMCKATPGPGCPQSNPDVTYPDGWCPPALVKLLFVFLALGSENIPIIHAWWRLSHINVWQWAPGKMDSTDN